MAAQTLVTGQSSNFDGPTLMLGLNNGEAISVNGGSLVINSDVRWNQNAAVFGSITVSSTLGGSVLFDGRDVWELKYSAATGNVPTQNNLGSNVVTGLTSGSTGELLRVWDNSALTPLASGGAMPATGWIKLRTKTGNFTAGEVVSLPGGATITIVDEGKNSWLNIVGAEAGLLTWPRLGSVAFKGNWYELGSTDGTDGQTFKYPVSDVCPAIWVEKYAGAYVAEGEVGLEPWLNAGPRWNQTVLQVAQDVRGKYFGQDAVTGIITIAKRDSNACGFKPANGLRVFIPNLILGNSTSANWNTNTVNATQVTRYKFSTPQGAIVDMDCTIGAWSINVSSASTVLIKRSAVLDGIQLSNVTNKVIIEDFAVGLSASATGYSPATLTSLWAGLQMKRTRLTKVIQGPFGVWTDIVGMDFEDVQLECFGATGSATRSAASTVTMRRCNGKMLRPSILSLSLSIETSQGLDLIDTKYADVMIGQTVTAIAMTPYAPNTGASNITVSGFESFGGLANVHSYSSILSVTAGCNNVLLTNVGTPDNPFNCGTVNPMGSAVGLSATSNTKLKRVYLSNNRIELVTLINTANGVELINAWGNPAINQIVDANDTVIRGCKWAPVTTVQSAVYGSIWQDQFTSLTAGAITITCNEPTPLTNAECEEVFSTGSGFTSAGSLTLVNIGDSVIWTMSYFALGYTALDSAAPVISGTNISNHTFEFQADNGTGFGTWQAFTGANLAAVGAINPAVGIKLKIKATVNTASPSNNLTNIRVNLITDTVSQKTQYPNTSAFTLTLTNVVVDSFIRVETTTGDFVYSTTATSSTVLLPLQAYETGSPLNNLVIKIRKGSSAPYYIPYETQTTAVAGSQTIFVSQIPD